MKLENTNRYLQSKLSENFFDTCAVYVACGEDTGFLSANADMDTFFDIASIGKVTVTAPLILRALGEGRLALSQTLPEFFPDVPGDKRSITVEQLLTHTSGIVRRGTPDEVIAAGRDAMAAYCLAQPLAYAPGSDYAYSCWGYLLLGCIAEKVCGMPLDAAFRQYIQEPLELERVGFGLTGREENIAVTHYRPETGDNACADDIVYRLKGVAGNGASFWSMTEMVKYARAVMARDARLYPRATFDLAERDYTPRFSEGRGLGWLMVDGRYPQTGDLFPDGSFGHCGNTGASMYFDRTRDLFVIVLSNAMRLRYMERDFRSADYGPVMQMRACIHNAIKADLESEGLL